MINVRTFLHDRRKAELQTIHQFWFPGESMLTTRGDLEARITEALVEGTHLQECVARLSRTQRSLLLSVLSEPDHQGSCRTLHESLESQGTPELEVENAGRMLLERGFLDRNRETEPLGDTYQIPEELAGNLVEVLDVSRRDLEAADQLSQKRLPFEIDFDGKDLRTRTRDLSEPALRDLVEIAVEHHGLADRNTPGVFEVLEQVQEQSPPAADNRRVSSRRVRNQRTQETFPKAWKQELEDAGIGTIGSVSLKDFGIQVDEPALIIFQEWIQLRSRAAVQEPVGPDTDIESGIDLYIDIDRVASLLEDEPLQLTREGKIPKRAYEHLRSNTHLPRIQDYLEADVVEMTVQLMQRMGIIEKYAGTLQIHEERLRVWRKQELVRQVEMLMDQYLEEKQGARWSFHQEILRGILIEFLQEHVRDDWVPLEALIGGVVSTYLMELEEREVRQHLRQRREADFARERLSSPFHRLGRDLVYWIVNRFLVLGVCELGMTDGKLSGFRLTALGKEVFGIERTPRESRILVNPDFEIMLFCEGLRGMRLELALSRFATRVSAERVRRYRVSRESARGGIRSGLCLAEIKRILQEAADHPLPEPVLVALRDWGKDLDWVQVEPTVVLSGLTLSRAQDIAEQLEECECDHSLYPDGTIVIASPEVQNGKWAKTLDALREDGWLLRVVGE